MAFRRHGPWLAAVLVVAAVLITWFSPFRRASIIARLERRTGAQVEIGWFQQKWFPPGFSAGQIHLVNAAGYDLRVDSFSVKASYTGLLRRLAFVPQIAAAGVRLWVPRGANGKLKTPLPEQRTGERGVAVGELLLDRVSIAVQAKASTDPATEYLLRRVTLHDADPERAVRYQAMLHYPKPAGEVYVRGTFGPVPDGGARRTPVSASFSFRDADLTVERGITGILSASGNCRGPANHVECTGTADVPRFQVYGSSHPVHVASQFAVAVDGLTGDAQLQRVVAQFAQTTVTATGDVAEDPEKDGKRVSVSTAVERGRVDDLLLLFTSRPEASMKGPIRLQARFVVPARGQDRDAPGFLKRLEAEGDFAIEGRFTNPKAQTAIDRLSASAEGVEKAEQREHPRLASEQIRGRVAAGKGVAYLRDVALRAPGITGSAAETFRLVEKQIDMRGVLQTSGKLGDTSSGLKAVVAKGFEMLMKKRGAVREIPFTVTGTSSRPIFRLHVRK